MKYALLILALFAGPAISDTTVPDHCTAKKMERMIHHRLNQGEIFWYTAANGELGLCFRTPHATEKNKFYGRCWLATELPDTKMFHHPSLKKAPTK